MSTTLMGEWVRKINACSLKLQHFLSDFLLCDVLPLSEFFLMLAAHQPDADLLLLNVFPLFTFSDKFPPEVLS